MKAKKEATKEQGKVEIGLSGTFLGNIEGKTEALMRSILVSRNVKGNIPGKQKVRVNQSFLDKA